MSMPVSPIASLAAAAMLFPAGLLPSGSLSAQATPKGHAMVVSVQHHASDAGLDIMKQGGNAVDAAVAVGFALAVVYPRAGNLGGGGFMMIRDHSGKAHFLDFRERAPMAATADMYLDAKGDVIPRMSTLGYKAIGVPGSVAGLVYARAHYGKLTLAQDMAPAIKLATEGFVLEEAEAQSLQSANMKGFPESVRVFQRGGDYYKAGETFKQPDLAQTLKRIAANPDEFYHGAMAAQLAKSVSSHGGLLTEADLAAYKVAEREPLLGHFQAHGQKYDVVTSPPPSSGGIVLIETLNILAGYDLPKLGGDRSPAQIHVIAEAYRRAFMDRADYLGDPDYNAIPLQQMASMKYAAAWRAGIELNKPTPSDTLKRPVGFLPPPPTVAPHKESNETTHFSVVDSHGNAVSMTYTLNGYYGCGATAEGLGIVLNNEMDDFSSKPGSMNMFHLVQGPANAIAPGHRPLSSMTPTIVTTHGGFFHRAKLVLVVGSPGGSTIPTTVTNDIISSVINGLSVQATADAPRFHHQYLPDQLQFEKAFPHETVDAMKAMGYTVTQNNEADTHVQGVWGGSELIHVDPKTGALEGANDPRYPQGKVTSY